MKISVICPSRLAVNPASPRGALYIERAIGSARRQTVAGAHEISICAGITEEDGRLPLLPREFSDIRMCWTPKKGQASALNCAIGMAFTFGKPDIIAFLEDDDHWHHQKLEYQLSALAQGFDFVSSSQREVDPDGNYVRVNDFPTMSGWIMRADLWRKVGPMDESYKWHLDNDWLGRLNKSGAKRLHFAEHAAVVNPRPWLKQVSQFSKIAVTDGLLEPMVSRTVNSEGGMSRIARDPEARAESQREHMMLWERHGSVIPW